MFLVSACRSCCAILTHTLCPDPYLQSVQKKFGRPSLETLDSTSIDVLHHPCTDPYSLPCTALSLQSVQKKSGQPSFKTLDSTIQTLNKDTGDRQAITYR
jgi:hypothetical protein